MSDTSNTTYLRFEYGQEDRIGVDQGPFEFLQMTYDWLRAGPDGEITIANYVDGLWVTPDGQKWSDFIVWGA